MTHSQATGHRCFWKAADLGRAVKRETGVGVQIGFEVHSKRGRS